MKISPLEINPLYGMWINWKPQSSSVKEPVHWPYKTSIQLWMFFSELQFSFTITKPWTICNIYSTCVCDYYIKLCVFMCTIAVDLRNTVLIATCKCYRVAHYCKSTVCVYVESTYHKGRKIRWVKLSRFSRFSRVPWKFFCKYIFILIQALYLGTV